MAAVRDLEHSRLPVLVPNLKVRTSKSLNINQAVACKVAKTIVLASGLVVIWFSGCEAGF